VTLIVSKKSNQAQNPVITAKKMKAAKPSIKRFLKTLMKVSNPNKKDDQAQVSSQVRKKALATTSSA
jgi:hypothetical protein